MKIKLSKSQWEFIGNKTGWIKTARIISEQYLEEKIDTGDFKLIKETPQESIYIDSYMNLRITVTYDLVYSFKDDPGAGYSFPCTKDGKILIGKMSPEAKKSLEYVQKNLDKFNPPVKNLYTSSDKLCDCGSGLSSEPQYDARGIFLTNTCPKCKKEKLSKYRSDVLTDSGYYADEPIEPEE
jgi:hypothetical protein